MRPFVYVCSGLRNFIKRLRVIRADRMRVYIYCCAPKEDLRGTSKFRDLHFITREFTINTDTFHENNFPLVHGRLDSLTDIVRRAEDLPDLRALKDHPRDLKVAQFNVALREGAHHHQILWLQNQSKEDSCETRAFIGPLRNRWLRFVATGSPLAETSVGTQHIPPYT